MILEYHRPENIEDALKLLERQDIKTIPIGGGSSLQNRNDDIAVMDTQSLSLQKIDFSGGKFTLGASTCLQDIVDFPSCPDYLRNALTTEYQLNLRNSATVAGALIKGNGRSIFASVMTALDAAMIWQKGNQEIRMGEWYANPSLSSKSTLITEIFFSKPEFCGFDFISRTLHDKPILSLSIAKWNSGRMRIVLGGFGLRPVLLLDGTGDKFIDSLMEDSLSGKTDAWASAEYRKNMGKVLYGRLISKMEAGAKS